MQGFEKPGTREALDHGVRNLSQEFQQPSGPKNLIGTSIAMNHLVNQFRDPIGKIIYISDIGNVGT